MPASAEESYQLNSGALWATVLNDVVAVRIRYTFFNVHRLPAHKTGQEIDQWACVVIAMNF
jgi:hypothetical protein